MSEDWVWSEERARGERLLGASNLRDVDEARILEVFRDRPRLVRDQVDRLASELKHGSGIRFPWSVLADRCERSRPEARVSGQDEREARVRAAESWLRSTGCLLDERQAEDHLFGPVRMTPPLGWLEQLERDTRGRPGRPAYGRLLEAAIERTRLLGPQPIEPQSAPLKPWIGDQDVAARVADVWADARPVGVASEEAAVEYQSRPWAHWSTRTPVASAGDTIIVDEAERARVLADLAAVA